MFIDDFDSLVLGKDQILSQTKQVMKSGQSAKRKDKSWSTSLSSVHDMTTVFNFDQQK